MGIVNVLLPPYNPLTPFSTRPRTGTTTGTTTDSQTSLRQLSQSYLIKSLPRLSQSQSNLIKIISISMIRISKIWKSRSRHRKIAELIPILILILILILRTMTMTMTVMTMTVIGIAPSESHEKMSNSRLGTHERNNYLFL